jgi:hypothetical protein
MKKLFSTIIVVSLITVSSLVAEVSEYQVDTYSLVGFEGGMSSLDVEKDDTVNPAIIQKHNFAHGGVKIGAQSENYRLFLSGRYYNAADFDYVTTFGAELQYMFHFSSLANFYLGANTGLANMRFTDGGTTSRTISDPYVGGDAGFNIHLGESTDFEIGTRIMSIQAQNKIGSVTYKFDSIVTAYASIIFKYKMD